MALNGEWIYIVYYVVLFFNNKEDEELQQAAQRSCECPISKTVLKDRQDRALSSLVW